MKQHHVVRGNTSLVDRVRQAASASVLVRSVLIGTLAISVTVGGGLAGALVVAPVVAQASRPGASTQATQLIADFSTTTLSTSRAIALAGMELAAYAISNLPAVVTRFALPGVALLAIVGALSTLFVRRRTPARSLTSAPSPDGPAASGRQRQTPRNSNWAGTKRQQTPRAVEALAASGATATDIAWKTRLPIDAVQLLLAISSGTRQLHPPAA